MSESYRPVPGHSHYIVSNSGIVQSLPREIRTIHGVTRKLHGKVLSPSQTQDGYRKVAICGMGKSRTLYVHFLVAMAWLGPPPGPVGCRRGEYQVHHINGARTDNRVVNLQWILVEDHHRLPRRKRMKGSETLKPQAQDRKPIQGHERASRSRPQSHL